VRRGLRTIVLSVLASALVALTASALPGSVATASRRGAARPAPCAHNGRYVFTHLARCGWAGPGNTGASVSSCAGHRLVDNSGSARRVIHVRRAHAVISCEHIVGCLSIEAKDVTVKNVNIACTSGRTGENANGTSVIYIDDGASATISRVTINGERGVHASLLVQYVNCRGVDDGVFSWADTGYSNTTGDHFTVRNSYFHAFTTRTANGHIDGYQTEGAANGSIVHNTYLMTSDDGNSTDSAVAIWDSLKNSHDITVKNNLIAGGGFSVYAEDYSPSESSPAGGFSVKRIYFRDNVFSRYLFGCVGYWGVWYPRGHPTDGWHRSGNHLLDSGANIDNHNPSSHGRSCT
jgi:hypothetical protein